jgi:transcriptional regulator with XRE-family HTH domain
MQTLKILRTQNGMTLEALAEQTGLTRSYLSKVERGLSEPSIGAAMSIARALNVTVEQLFGQQADNDPISITRARDGKPGNTAAYLSLLAGGGHSVLKAFVIRPGQDPGRTAAMSKHDGEEVLFVLSGSIQIQLGQRREIVEVGDCLHFNSRIPHRMKTMSTEPASVLVIVASRAP